MSGEPLLVTSQSRVMPGLMPDEALLLRRWLELHEGEWERVFANVRVGPGYDPGESWPEHARQMAILNTQRRIDALAERGAKAEWRVSSYVGHGRSFPGRSGRSGLGRSGGNGATVFPTPRSRAEGRISPARRVRRGMDAGAVKT